MGSCLSCPLGIAAGVGRGGFCSLVARRRAPGEIIHLEGTRGATVWYVKRGAVVVSRGGRAVATRREGSLLGLELLVRERYLETARALGGTVLCGLARADLDAWLADAGRARAILESALRAQSADAPRGAGVDGPSRARVARWLLDGVDEAVPRRTVASLLGMAPETLSRALAGLARAGAIATTRRSVRVLDRRALEQVARGAT
jgi:CRP/FNR family transcriptional regulator